MAARAWTADTMRSRRHADIRGDQEFFEGTAFPRRRSPCGDRRIGTPRDLVKPAKQLLRRRRSPSRTLEQAHQGFYHPPSGSLRWGRSIDLRARRGSLRRPARRHLLSNRQFQPWRAASATAASVVLTPSATIFMPASTPKEAAVANSTPTCRLRLYGPVQVSTRRRARQTGECLAPATGGDCQPRDLDEPGVISAAWALWPSPSFCHTAAIAITFLSAHRFDPHDVGRRVETEGSSPELLLHAPGGGTVGARHGDRRRQLRATSIANSP